MIRKYRFGSPFSTEAVVADIPVADEAVTVGSISTEEGFSFTCTLQEEDVVYGLGENMRGINKRGYTYTSFASDDPAHTEDKHSLYAAHNFIVVSGKETFGLFVDYPTKLTFDIGYTRQDTLRISCEYADLDLYVITGDTAYDVVKQFRKIIGRSYIPPKFAFGFGQSRWGYKTAEDFKKVAEEHRKAHMPLDMVYMDIDYMQDYKDFTLNQKEFPDFRAYVDEMKKMNIHLIPIIDAGVKCQEGYDICEEGREKGYFCKRADGSDFEAAVWPGWTHFPDVLNPEARAWFGSKYQILIDQGIDGFWNDMNEPATFYTKEGVTELVDYLKAAVEEDLETIKPLEIQEKAMAISNNPADYENMYHNVNGEMIPHSRVHNLFGYNMTRAAGEAFEKISPDNRILMFSRSSYVGMHRYGGVWMGDNRSWWSHILLNLQMLPSMNMCGFLYTGADLGGFGDDTTRDLVLRWLALGVFTPLMRNHSALGTREQEFYQFENIEDFRHVIGVRYRLVPYLYSEYMKAALGDDMLFKPLAFEYPQDAFASQVEDQLMLGGQVMIAPVYKQNAKGRYVYLPEEMIFVKFLPDGSISQETLSTGHHYVDVALNEVPLFIRKGCSIPVVDAAECVGDLDLSTMKWLGYEGAQYQLYDDDGITRL
ncbi:MAG: glycoside hydrolase family 31 protein [Lachnospiraceae bacterium]|nr:glycoside hydrolase family 31 protein [Lachnospiraceae bacterium]